jgi:hypothetical protein
MGGPSERRSFARTTPREGRTLAAMQCQRLDPTTNEQCANEATRRVIVRWEDPPKPGQQGYAGKIYSRRVRPLDTESGSSSPETGMTMLSLMETLRQYQWLVIAALLAVAIVAAAWMLRPRPAAPQADPREVACIQRGGSWLGDICLSPIG